MDFIREALLQNPHWETGRITFPEGRIVERSVFQTAWNSAQRKFITILRGLRRTGKSFLAKQIASAKLEESASPKQVAWFEFDRAMNAFADDLDSLMHYFQSQGAGMVVLDEVVFVPLWQDVLKRHYDRSGIKIIATGSSAIELDKRSSESLAGRFQTIHVNPFSLAERMELCGSTPPTTSLQEAQSAEEMEAQAQDYLSAGGIPEATLEKDERTREAYLRESLLDPLFYKDFPAVFPKANPDSLIKTLDVLSSTVGSTYQLQTIAQALSCRPAEASLHVELLQKTLLVNSLYNYTKSVVKQRRTSKKITFADTGILKALRPDAEYGKLAENAAAQATQAKYFWRDSQGHEVDLVFPDRKLAMEVKYQNTVTATDEKNLRYFLSNKKGWKGVVITKRQEKKEGIEHLPLWKLLLDPEGTKLKTN